MPFVVMIRGRLGALSPVNTALYTQRRMVGRVQEGSQFGQYHLIKRIAIGGMAEIHLAKSRGIGGFEKLLALKVIHPKFSDDREFIDMLIDEAKIAVQLSHVNIGQVFDLGEIEGTYFIAMEFIDGQDLYQLLVRCSELNIEIPFDVIVYIALEASAGLHYAHMKSDNYGRVLNLIHRDISPQNILISYDGEVKIIDFGIAKASQRSKETESGVIKGKFFYMSPEQAWGDNIDSRTDIFSMGICIYEMITGEMLYNEEKALALLDKVRKAEIPPMRKKRRELPPALEQIVLRALTRDRDQRYQTAGELHGALSAFLYSNWPSFRRRRLADFMREAFGDQRFILPMPNEDEMVTVERAAPTESGGGFMDAEDFDAEEHSVIFHMGQNLANPQSAARKQEPFRVPSDDFSDGPGRFGDDDDEQEQTLIGESWADGNLADLLPDEDEDETAVIDMDTVDAARALSRPGSDDLDQPTALFDARSGLAAPQALSRPVKPTAGPNVPLAAGPPVVPKPIPRPPSTSALPGPVAAPTPAAIPNPRRKPGPAGVPPPNHSAELNRPTMHGAGEQKVKVAKKAKAKKAKKTKKAKGRGGKKSVVQKLLSPAGITVVVLVGLILYAAIVFIPTLLADKEPAQGALVISTVPAGASIVLNDEDTGKTSPARLPNMRVGTNHELKVELKGYASQSESVTIKEDELTRGNGEIRRRFILEKSKGTLKVTSEPSGADIFIDGRFMGKTPFSKKGLNREKNELVLLIRMDGYRQRNSVLTWGDETSLEHKITLSKRGK